MKKVHIDECFYNGTELIDQRLLLEVSTYDEMKPSPTVTATVTSMIDVTQQQKAGGKFDVHYTDMNGESGVIYEVDEIIVSRRLQMRVSARQYMQLDTDTDTDCDNDCIAIKLVWSDSLYECYTLRISEEYVFALPLKFIADQRWSASNSNTARNRLAEERSQHEKTVQQLTRLALAADSMIVTESAVIARTLTGAQPAEVLEMVDKIKKETLRSALHEAWSYLKSLNLNGEKQHGTKD